MKKKEIKTSALKKIVEKVKTFKPILSERFDFSVELGWFKSDNVGIKGSLFEYYGDAICFFDIKIIKFSFCIEIMRKY